MPRFHKYSFTHGPSDQRTVSRSYENNSLKNTTWYDGAYEKDSTSTRVRQIHYISVGAGLAAIFVRTNNVDTMYYVHTDHLGSFDLITSSTGAVKDRYSFDSWGSLWSHQFRVLFNYWSFLNRPNWQWFKQSN